MVVVWGGYSQALNFLFGWERWMDGGGREGEGKEVRERGRVAGEFDDCLCALFLFAGQKNRLEKELWGGGGGREGCRGVSLSGAGSQPVGQRVPALGERSWTSPRHRRAPRPAPRSHGGSAANLPGGAAIASPPETSLFFFFFFFLFFSKGVLFSFSSLSSSPSFFITIIILNFFRCGLEWGGENCIFQIRLRKGWGWGVYLGLRILSSASDNLEVFGESRGGREGEREKQASRLALDRFFSSRLGFHMLIRK